MSIWECLRIQKTYHKSLRQVKRDEKKNLKASKQIKKTQKIPNPTKQKN